MKSNNKEEGLNVFVRVRPPISKEVKHTNAVTPSGNSVRVTTDKGHSTCAYDCVFDEFSSQDNVFTRVKPLLKDVLKGINACVFAYGQTSSGKTHTMLGCDGGNLMNDNKRENWGIIPRATEFLFSELADKADQGTFILYIIIVTIIITIIRINIISNQSIFSSNI